MTDLTVETSAFQATDRPWLLFEADGVSGPVARDHGVIDFESFTEADHYPNGYIKSGTALALSGDGKRLVRAGGSGAGAAAGLLFNDTPVPRDRKRKVGVAFIDSFAVVRESKLPKNHGVTGAVKTALPLVKFRA